MLTGLFTLKAAPYFRRSSSLAVRIPLPLKPKTEEIQAAFISYTNIHVFPESSYSDIFPERKMLLICHPSKGLARVFFTCLFRLPSGEAMFENSPWD